MLRTLLEKTADGVYQMRGRYEAAGDSLRMHKHPLQPYHDVRVLKGSVIITGVEWSQPITLSAGEAVVFTDEQAFQHEVTALEPGTEILNIYRPFPKNVHPYCGEGVEEAHGIWMDNQVTGQWIERK